MSRPQTAPAIESLRQLCLALVDERLTVRELAQRLGDIEVDHGGDLQIVVRPRDASFTRIDVLRQPRTERPYSLDVQLAPTASLLVASLQQSFGSYNEAPQGEHDLLPEIIFYPDRATAPMKCSLVAQVTPGVRGIQDGAVSRITILRDGG